MRKENNMKISEAELEVMQVIWNKKQTNSLEIASQLEHKNWTHQTIRTLITRLVAKNAIRIVEKKGKKYIYEAIIDEEDYKKEALYEFIDKVFKGNLQKLLEMVDEA